LVPTHQFDDLKEVKDDPENCVHTGSIFDLPGASNADDLYELEQKYAPQEDDQDHGESEFMNDDGNEDQDDDGPQTVDEFKAWVKEYE
jgi:hypothetical protein